MPELELLRMDHAAIAAPSSQATAAARARLATAIGREVPRRRPLPRPALIVVAVVGAVVGVLLLPPWGRESSVPVAAAAARRDCLTAPSGRCVRALAAVAALHQPGGHAVLTSSRLGAVRFFEVGPDGRLIPDHGSFATGGTFAVGRDVMQRDTFQADGTTETTLVGLEPARLLRASDVAIWRRAGAPDLEALFPAASYDDWNQPADVGPHPSMDVLGQGDLVPAMTRQLGGGELSRLPVDPAQLASTLRLLAWDQAQHRTNQPCAADLVDCVPDMRLRISEIFGADIKTLLQYPLASARLRAALFAVIANEHVGAVLGPRRDLRGRAGVALRLPTDQAEGADVILLDPSTAYLLATGDLQPDGSVLWMETVALGTQG
jgi:hypothetical protein